jgi:membrane-associated phospholipid phosphatase
VQEIASPRRRAGRAGRTARAVRPAGWWFDAALLAGFVALTVALAAGALLGVDEAIADWCRARATGVSYWVARTLNYLGQGTPLTLLCLGIAIWRGARIHSVRLLLPVAAAFLLTYVTIGPLKLWIDRAAPAAGQVELFGEGVSYPSGHLVNAIVWYGVLALLLAPWLSARARWVLRVGPPAIVFAATTYLGFHWLTDSIAGVLLGVLLDRLLSRVPWDDVPLPRRLAGWAGPAVFTRRQG